MQVKTLRKGAWIVAITSVGATLAIVGTRLYKKGRQRDDAATEIIGQLAIIYDKYLKGLKDFVEDASSTQSVTDQFGELSAAVRIDTAPWDICPMADYSLPGILKLFVNGPRELLVHLQRRLPGSGLPLTPNYEYKSGDSSDSLYIELEVDNKQLIAAVTAKLTKS